MRFITCYQYLNEDKELIKKVEVHITKTNNIQWGQNQIISKLALEYNLKDKIIERKFEDDGSCKQLGLFYLRPIRDNSPIKLSDIDIDFELEKYERYNIVGEIKYPYY